MQKEQEKDLQSQVDLANMLEQMVMTPGWHSHFAPWLQSMRKGFIKGLLTASEHDKMLAAQQNVNLIDQIFSFVDINIKVGKGASQKLAGATDDKIEEDSEG